MFPLQNWASKELRQSIPGLTQSIISQTNKVGYLRVAFRGHLTYIFAAISRMSIVAYDIIVWTWVQTRSDIIGLYTYLLDFHYIDGIIAYRMETMDVHKYTGFWW